MKRLALLLLLALPAVARADVAPGPGYVEECTVEKACAKGEEGDTCSTYFKEPDKCSKLHAGDGFVFKCRTRGASVWKEVWCRKKK